MKVRYHLRLHKDGSIEFLGDAPPMFPMGKPVTRRFSEIVPTFPPLLILFRLLRLLFGEKGRVAEWTRHWPCQWRATILMGRHHGQTTTDRRRATLIEWEHERWFHPKVDL